MTELGAAERAGEWLFCPMDEACAREIALWCYPPPYSFYNCPADAIEDEVRCLLDSDHRYWAVKEECGELVGFVGVGDDCRVPGGDYSAGALDVGGGLRPDRTGRGLGAAFWRAALEVALRRYAPETFRVTVAAFNGRALRVWERLGFRRVDSFEAHEAGVPFVILVREAASPASQHQLWEDGTSVRAAHLRGALHLGSPAGAVHLRGALHPASRAGAAHLRGALHLASRLGAAHLRGPLHLREKSMAYRDWFCEDVLSGKIEVTKVWEDERVLAFHHPRPKAKVHVVVIPKAHVSGLLDPLALDGALLISMLQAIQHSARALGLDKAGFYVRANAAAPGVTPHMHWHIMGPGVP